MIGSFPQVRESIIKDHNKYWPALCLNRTRPDPNKNPRVLPDQAVSILRKIHPIKELEWEDRGGLVISDFARTMNRQLVTNGVGLQPLKKLELYIASRYWRFQDEIDILSEELPTLLATQPLLKQLSMEGPWGKRWKSRLPLKSLIRKVYLPKLEVLTRKDFCVSPGTLQAFFSLHQSTLEEFDGSFLWLLGGTCADALDTIRECSSLRRFAVNALFAYRRNPIWMKSPWDREKDKNLTYNETERVLVFDGAEVEIYVLHGDSNPFRGTMN